VEVTVKPRRRRPTPDVTGITKMRIWGLRRDSRLPRDRGKALLDDQDASVARLLRTPIGINAYRVAQNLAHR
jgi:hypothetical protein